MNLYDNMVSIAKKMQIDVDEITSEIEHRGIKGTAREEIIIKFLEQYLPQKYSIETGMIIDSNSKQSNQQDIFIYDNNVTPRFLNYDSEKIIPIESVRCVLEIKSNLTTEELQKAFLNIYNTRKLEKCFFNKTSSINYPFWIIIAYKSTITLEKIKEEVNILKKQYELNFGPTAIFILDKGSITACDSRNPTSYSLFPDKESIFSIQESSLMGDNLMLLYILIISGLFFEDSLAYQPDIISYAHKSGFVTPVKHFNKKDLQNSIIDLDGKKIDISKMYKVQEYFKSLSKDERLSPENILNLISMLNEACPNFFESNIYNDRNT